MVPTHSKQKNQPKTQVGSSFAGLSTQKVGIDT
jgi:hypothetical protein